MQNRQLNARSRSGLAILATALCLTLTIISTLSATAMTMVATNLAQLSETAESAFVIRIDSIETTASQGRPCDQITGTIVEPIFGNVQTSQTKSWNQFRLGPGLGLPGMPEYEVGKEYLLFLSGKGPGPGFQSPVGMGQGAFSVMRNPQTGAVAVRNAFMNRTLGAGLDLNAAANDMVAGDARVRGMSPNQRKSEADKLKMQLRSGPQNSLGAIKQAARFFHDQKVKGNKPSQDYRTSAPLQVLR